MHLSILSNTYSGNHILLCRTSVKYEASLWVRPPVYLAKYCRLLLTYWLPEASYWGFTRNLINWRCLELKLRPPSCKVCILPVEVFPLTLAVCELGGWGYLKDTVTRTSVLPSWFPQNAFMSFLPNVEAAESVSSWISEGSCVVPQKNT